MDSLERLERLELVCMWFEGAAVQGRWRGELGEALTGRRVKCCSERGLGIWKSRCKVGGVGMRELTLFDIVAGGGPGGERGFSKSEQ